jgi:hypothetical protein
VLGVAVLLLLCFSEAGYEQDDSTNKQYGTQHRSKRDVMLLINGSVNRTDIDHLPLRCVRDALIGKRNNRQNDKNYSRDRYCLHLQILSVVSVCGTGQHSFDYAAYLRIVDPCLTRDVACHMVRAKISKAENSELHHTRKRSEA